MWPFKKVEKRESGGGYTSQILALAEAQAHGTASPGGTAALEAASGLIGRTLAAAKCECQDKELQKLVSPDFLLQVGRDLVRNGQSLYLISWSNQGLVLLPSSNWNWQSGDANPRSWKCQVTTYGPSQSKTQLVGFDQVCFFKWGSFPGTTYEGRSPHRFASISTGLNSNLENQLSQESSGPVTNILPVDLEGGAAEIDQVRRAIAGAKGKPLLLKTLAGGHGDQMSKPMKDWVPNRLGANFPQSSVQLARDSFSRTLSACGIPPSLFLENADGTSQREGLRRFHLSTIVPIARLIESELQDKLDQPDLKLHFDSYAKDQVSRAQVFAKLTAGGIEANEALKISELLNE